VPRPLILALHSPGSWLHVEILAEWKYSRVTRNIFDLAPLSYRARLWDAAVLFGNWFYMRRIILLYGALYNAHRGWK
jgi:hypothetical protein